MTHDDLEKRNYIYVPINVEEELPELNKFVPCVDKAGEIIIYRRVNNTPPKAIGLQWAWNMRDSTGTNSPNNNLEIVCWLKRVAIFEDDEKKNLSDILCR